jgi:hypothetical protein
LRRRVLASVTLRRRVRDGARLVRRNPAFLVDYHFMTYLRMSIPLAAGVCHVPFPCWVAIGYVGAFCFEGRRGILQVDSGASRRRRMSLARGAVRIRRRA